MGYPLRVARWAPRTVALALGAAAITGCGGAEKDTAAAPQERPAAARQADPAAFAAVVKNPRAFVLNVHVPDEGSIAGTDAAIPFDQLRERRAELPDRSTPLAVYCRTGRMSAEAVGTLADLGYRDVVELRGGMVAWAASGRPLLPAR